MKNLKICKSNDIIEAGYRLTLNEQRLILACIAQINSQKNLNNKRIFTIRAQEFAELFNISKNRAYSELKKVADRLYIRSITIFRPTNKKQYLKTRWISSIAYGDNCGEVDIRFSEDIIPYLASLRTEFTQYELINICGMTSIYAIRLYENLMQWKEVGRKEIEIKQLKKSFEIEREYPRMYDLKKYVLTPAIEQINKHSDFWVKYDQKKRGRKITHFIFTFGLKTKPTSLLDVEKFKINPDNPPEYNE